jgi:diguanylate cyclase (GGDEF)-like protein/PAS domain S-box-containing protein
METGTTIGARGVALRGPRLPGWAWYAATAALVAALYLGGPLNSGPVFNLLGASAAVAIIAGTRRHAPRARAGWQLIALGQTLFVAGDVIAYNYEALFGGELPFPSMADPFYLAIYPCLVVGLMVLLRASNPSRDRGTLIDALVMTVGVGTLSWVFLMAPYAHDASLGTLAKATSLAYPLMDLLLLGVGARLILGGTRRGASARMLAAALFALLATDAVYGWALLHGGYEPGGLLDGGWIAFYVLVGAAALHPAMVRLSDGAPRRTERLTRRRLGLLVATSLLAPAVQLVRSLLHEPREPVISVAAGVLFVLVLARLADLVRVHEAQTETLLRDRFEARLAALVRHASDAVTLLDATGRIVYMSPSGRRLLGARDDAAAGGRWEALVHPDEVEATRACIRGLPFGDSIGLEHRLVRADGTCIEAETLATNLLGDDAVDAVVLNTRDVTERKALERQLAHQATHDALTGLPSRRLIVDRLDQALARGRRTDSRVALLFVDLDDFKPINDALGHAAGDDTLRQVAGRLQASIRDSDSAGRIGGDEFAVVLDGVAGPEEAVAVAERCLAALAEPLVVAGSEVTATASIGIALAPAAGCDADRLLGEADAAMYVAKRQGKGRYAVSGADLDAVAGPVR